MARKQLGPAALITTDAATKGYVDTATGTINARLNGNAVTIAGTALPLGGTITQDTITGLSTTGLVKRTGTNALAAAVAGTDYAQTLIDTVHSDSLTTGQSTFSRRHITSADVPSTNGVCRYTFFTARKSETVTQVRVPCGSTGAVYGGSGLARIGIYTIDGSGNLTLAASTVAGTNLWNVANTSYTKALSASYSVVRGQRYAIGVIVFGTTTAPTFVGINPGGAVTEWGEGPRLAGMTTGRTNLDTSLAYTSIVNTSAQVYAVVLP